MATQLGYKVLWNISIKEPRNTGFLTDLLVPFFPSLWRPAFFTAVDRNFAILFFSRGAPTYQTSFSDRRLCQTVKENGDSGAFIKISTGRWLRNFFVKTDRTSRCIGGINLWLKRSLVSSVLIMSGFCASVGQPNQDFSAIILLLKLNVTPA